MATVSELLLEALASAGCRQLYGVPGDALNALLEAERREHQIEFIHVRHEEAGAFAASAQAKLTGSLAACMGTVGPGAVHLLNGLYDAKRDRAPVLAITGQVETQQIGSNYHQEVDTLALFADVAVFNAMIANADDAPRLVSAAIAAAIEQRGVAHLSLPLDIAGAPVRGGEDLRPAETTHDTAPAGELPAPQMLDEAGRMLADADKVVILAGVGCRGAAAELVELAQRVGAPIIKTLPAKDLLPDEHPLSLGMLGLLGTRPAVQAVEHCDLLLLSGTDFPYQDFYPEGKTAIQIDVDLSQLGHRYPIALGLAGDCKRTLAALAMRVEPKREQPFLEEYQEAMRRWWRELDEVERDIRDPIQPQRLARLAGELASDGAVFTCDTGAVTYWAARNLRLRERQRFTLSANLASMAYALPGAIGAQLAYSERQVIALIGDGGLSMMLGELMTLKRHALPVKVVVFNNRKLGLIQMEQEARGLPEYQTGISDADFAAIARACGIGGRRVEDPSLLEDALRECYATPGPYLLDVLIHEDELTMPPVIHWKHAFGFARAKVKEFFGLGDSGEV